MCRMQDVEGSIGTFTSVSVMVRRYFDTFSGF